MMDLPLLLALFIAVAYFTFSQPRHAGVYIRHLS